jgi:hypothetical protein
MCGGSSRTTLGSASSSASSSLPACGRFELRGLRHTLATLLLDRDCDVAVLVPAVGPRNGRGRAQAETHRGPSERITAPSGRRGTGLSGNGDLDHRDQCDEIFPAPGLRLERPRTTSSTLSPWAPLRVIAASSRFVAGPRRVHHCRKPCGLRQRGRIVDWGDFTVLSGVPHDS